MLLVYYLTDPNLIELFKDIEVNKLANIQVDSRKGLITGLEIAPNSEIHEIRQDTRNRRFPI